MNEINDSEIGKALRDAMPRGQPPDFDAVWAAAEERHRRSRRRNAALGSVAAAATVAAILAGLWPAVEQPPADEFRIAYSLEHTTRWQAPSDALLPDYRDDIYTELPQLMESTELVGGSLL